MSSRCAAGAARPQGRDGLREELVGVGGRSRERVRPPAGSPCGQRVGLAGRLRGSRGLCLLPGAARWSAVLLRYSPATCEDCIKSCFWPERSQKQTSVCTESSCLFLRSVPSSFKSAFSSKIPPCMLSLSHSPSACLDLRPWLSASVLQLPRGLLLFSLCFFFTAT